MLLLRYGGVITVNLEFLIHWITFAFFKNSLNNNAVINGPAAADTSISAVGQPLNPSTDGQLPTPFTTGPPIQNTQGTVGDGKTNSGKEPSPQKKETGNSYDYSTLKIRNHLFTRN